MLNTLKIFEELKETIEPSAAKKIAEVVGKVYEELSNVVTKVEFNELKDVVRELAEAQKRTEQRVGELAEAQKRTEQRVEELAEAQKRTEERLTRLETIVGELAEAQKRTEERLTRLEEVVEELAEVQKRTEHVIEELVEAQKRTEAALEELISEHTETRRQLGGLAMTVGYTLENEAYKALPRLLKENLGFDIKGKVKRQYVRDNRGEYIEVNIIGEALKDSRRITIVGEGKSQLSKNDVDKFIKKKLRRLTGMYTEIFPLLVVHMTSGPEVEEYAREKGIAIYYSYDF